MDIENAVGNSIDTKLGSLIIIQFLGRGKSGYSYLAECAGAKYVVKLMHYEPCAHYSFGDSNKVDLEVSAYNVL